MVYDSAIAAGRSVAGTNQHGNGIMGIFSKLFGSGSTADAAAGSGDEGAVEYNGYSIRPAPRRQGSAWLLAGVIAKEFPDGVKEHAYVRADTFAGRDEAVAFAITKGKQIIDERGDRLFETS